MTQDALKQAVAREAIKYVFARGKPAFAFLHTIRDNPLRATVVAEAEELADQLARTVRGDQPAMHAHFAGFAAKLREALAGPKPE